jgi:hypothetical protein
MVIKNFMNYILVTLNFCIIFLLLSQNIYSDTDTLRHYHTDSIQIESNRFNLKYPFYMYDSILSVGEITDLRQLTGVIPGFYISDYGSRMSGGIYYRGIGNRFNGSGVIVYVDGVPMLSGLEAGLNLSDVGALYLGQQSNSVSGLSELHITSRSVLHSGTEIFASYGNANTGKIKIEHNNSIGDVYYGILFNAYHTDGFEKNIYNDFLADNRKDYSITLKLDCNLYSDINSAKALHSQTKLHYNYLTENGFPYRLYENDILHPLELNDLNAYKNNLFMIIENLD